MKKGPVVRTKIILSDQFQIEVRARWRRIDYPSPAPPDGVTKVIVKVNYHGRTNEFRAVWAFSDGPIQALRYGFERAKEDAFYEAKWAVKSFLHFLGLALRRKTVCLFEEPLLHFRAYRGMQDGDSWQVLSGLELAGEWARLVKIAYVPIHSEIALKRPTDYEEFERFVGEKLEDSDDELIDLRPILQAKSLADLVLPKSVRR